MHNVVTKYRKVQKTEFSQKHIVILKYGLDRYYNIVICKYLKIQKQDRQALCQSASTI